MDIQIPFYLNDGKRATRFVADNHLDHTHNILHIADISLQYTFSEFDIFLHKNSLLYEVDTHTLVFKWCRYMYDGPKSYIVHNMDTTKNPQMYQYLLLQSIEALDNLAALTQFHMHGKVVRPNDGSETVVEMWNDIRYEHTPKELTGK